MKKPLLRWLPPLLFLLATAAAAWRIPQPTAPAFVAPPPAQSSTLPAVFQAEMLPVAAESAHAASLARLPDGRLAAAWFAGSREGAADVAIWYATLERSGWSEPRAIASRESTAAGSLAYVRKLGNPVLYVDGNRLHLWYVTVALGGWAGSAIHYAHSDDNGRTWSAPRKLRTSPFGNISTLVRTPPLPLADGSFGLPAYHEFITKHGEWLRLSPTGQVLDKARMADDRPLLQPAVTALDAQHAIALLRDAGPSPQRVHVSQTANGGLSWQSGGALPIANPNSSVALLRLRSGRLLLAGNPESGRSTLQLWLSEDDGKTWRSVRAIETAPDGGAEFSYPALLLAPDGLIHIAYTWRRKGIKHAVFSEAWLDGGAP
jgi:predicted neuraminidase